MTGVGISEDATQYMESSLAPFRISAVKALAKKGDILITPAGPFDGEVEKLQLSIFQRRQKEVDAEKSGDFLSP